MNTDAPASSAPTAATVWIVAMRLFRQSRSVTKIIATIESSIGPNASAAMPVTAANIPATQAAARTSDAIVVAAGL